MRKPVSYLMRTTRSQISLRIRKPPKTDSLLKWLNFPFSAAEIKTKVDIDYEKIAKKFTLPFNVDITAVDSRGEISQTGRLEINIKDINEPPKFKEKNYKLDANEDSVSNR